MRIAVVGNCQARPLGTALTEARPDVEIASTLIVHLAKDDERDEALEALDKADLILAQRVQPDYPTEFVRTQALRDTFGDRVIVWPNMYYRGYNPELLYLRDAARRPMQGPLGDYHLQAVRDAWLAGGTVEDALHQLTSVEANRSTFAEVPESSLDELQSREAECDVAISDWIRERRWHERTFFTFNHPTAAVLRELTRRIAQACGLGEITVAGGPAEPLGRWRMPVNPWVLADLAPELTSQANFQGCDVDFSGERPMAMRPVQALDHVGLVERFFAVYDADGRA